MKNSLFIFILFICSFGFSQTWTPIGFTIMDSDCEGASTYNELFISEVFDNNGGSFGAIELYNPTNLPISLSSYSMRRTSNYGDGIWTPEWNQITAAMSGRTIPANSAFLIYLGTANFNCPQTPDISNTNSFTGINQNDQIQLLKNGGVIDDVKTPGNIGYTLIRRPDADVPNAVYTATEWFINDSSESCFDLDSHTIDDPEPPTITAINRQTSTFCTTPTRVQIIVADGEAPYQRSMNGGPFVNHGTGVINNLTAGNYTVVIRDANGCTVTAEFTINPATQTSPIVLIP